MRESSVGLVLASAAGLASRECLLLSRNLLAEFECNGRFCELPLISLPFFQFVFDEHHFSLDRGDGELLRRCAFSNFSIHNLEQGRQVGFSRLERFG